MRPPEFTGGNGGMGGRPARAPSSFNEAAGIHRRKRKCWYGLPVSLMSFNEAAGIHRRKRAGGLLTLFPWEVASMRPPEFTGGNASAGTDCQ